MLTLKTQSSTSETINESSKFSDDVWLQLIAVAVSVNYPLFQTKKRERERKRNQNSQEKTCNGNRQASDFEKHVSSKASLRHHRHLVFWLHSDLDLISPQPRFGSTRLGFLVLASEAANLGPRIWFRAALLGITAACDGLERRFSKEIINRNEAINLEIPINYGKSTKIRISLSEKTKEIGERESWNLVDQLFALN